MICQQVNQDSQVPSLPPIDSTDGFNRLISFFTQVKHADAESITMFHNTQIHSCFFSILQYILYTYIISLAPLYT